MSFEKYTTKKLKSFRGVLYGIAIAGLILFCFVIGVSIYGIEHGKEVSLLATMVILVFPSVFIPLLFATLINKEIKKRE